MKLSPRQKRWAAAGASLAAGTVVLQLRHARQIARDPQKELLSDPPRGRTISVRSADGTLLCAEIYGADQADAPTAVLAHGWTENRTYWIHQIRALSAQGLRVIAYDHRGHGDSERAAGRDYAIGRFGEDLEAVLETCQVRPENTIVAGHSLGAMAIVGWADGHDVTARVSGALLINTGVGDLIAESLLVPVPSIAKAISQTVAVNGFLGSRAPLPRFSSPLSQALIRYIAFGPTATAAQIAFYERMLIASPPDARADIGIALSEVELYHALPRLTVPTIVLAGAKDRLTPPSHAKRIAEQLPQLVRLTILPETGHMAPLERPEEVNRALLELSQHPARELTGSAKV
jgi:pimeloyl-ACP methyl ester carboxylesterase